MAGPACGVAVVGRSHRRIEAAILALPLCPQPIHVAVKQEEQRIFWGRRWVLNGAAKTRMRKPVRIAFHGPERFVQIADTQRLRFGEKTRRRDGGVEVGPAVDPLHTIRLPELKRVRRAERDSAESIGGAEEIQLEN